MLYYNHKREIKERKGKENVKNVRKQKGKRSQGIHRNSTV